MDEKTKALVETAEKMAEAATPGPWFGSRVGVLHGSEWVVANVPGPDGTIMSSDDADFIECARASVPALCAAVREMDAAAQERETWIGIANERIATLARSLDEQDAKIAQLESAQAFLGTNLQSADATIKRLLARIGELEADEEERRLERQANDRD